MSHFSLFDVLEIDTGRANEMSAELHGLVCDPSNNLQDVSRKLHELYAPESLLMGAFLGLAILINNKQVLSRGGQTVSLNVGEKVRTRNTSKVICPFCGHEYDESYELIGLDLVECDVCGACFELESDETVTYTTRKPDWLRRWQVYNRNQTLKTELNGVQRGGIV